MRHLSSTEVLHLQERESSEGGNESEKERGEGGRERRYPLLANLKQ